MRRISFLPRAFDDFVLWASEDKKIHAKIVQLINDIQRTSFSGIGKPEPYKT